MIKTYVKRPVEVQAVQWTGENRKEIKDFVGPDCFWKGVVLVINTLEGAHYAKVGDYIIRGVKGEFYPCKPDIFEQTYEESVVVDPNLFSRECTMTKEEIERLISR